MYRKIEDLKIHLRCQRDKLLLRLRTISLVPGSEREREKVPAVFSLLDFFNCFCPEMSCGKKKSMVDRRRHPSTIMTSPFGEVQNESSCILRSDN